MHRYKLDQVCINLPKVPQVNVNNEPACCDCGAYARAAGPQMADLLWANSKGTSKSPLCFCCELGIQNLKYAIYGF